VNKVAEEAAAAPHDTTHYSTFTLDVAIPTPKAPSVLKIASYMDITDTESGLRKYFPLQVGVSSFFVE
jgi:hypothetical protein